MKKVLRVVCILISFATVASLSAQSYYARSNLGIGLSTGLITVDEKSYNVNALGLSLLKNFDLATGRTIVNGNTLNVYSLSLYLKVNQTRCSFPLYQLQ
jgi:hypothetical protein